ncbi:MAG: RDD family protein [Halofilum sp. (in: g-proteobacteria)]|nr:RDD family protein [Halofilum sp. (in: g-proteobacteria)]
MTPDEPGPAALWRRLVAAVLDAAALAAATLLAGTPTAGASSPALLVLGAALAMFYRVLFEGSRLAATPGKLALGLRVRGPGGGDLPFATAAVRAWPWWLTGAVAGIAPGAVPVAALLSLAAIAAIPLSARAPGPARPHGRHRRDRAPREGCPRNPAPTARMPQRRLRAIVRVTWEPPRSPHDRPNSLVVPRARYGADFSDSLLVGHADNGLQATPGRERVVGRPGPLWIATSLRSS